MIIVATIEKKQDPECKSSYIKGLVVADGEQGSDFEVHSIEGAADPRIEDVIQEQIKYMLDNDYIITRCFKSDNKFVLVGESE